MSVVVVVADEPMLALVLSATVAGFVAVVVTVDAFTAYVELVLVFSS